MFGISLVFWMVSIVAARGNSDEETTTEFPEADLSKIFPSEKTLEEVSVRLLDALIKRGQMEMAKGAFKTQMEVLRKVQPEQYERFKKISVDQLAAEAVMEQAEAAKFIPKTGNRFVDMLHENGIPIGSSIKGIQQAIKTQREMENNDPAEQILKAVLEKFQKQILPGIVANAIAGKNPFQMPSKQEIQQLVNEKREDAKATKESNPKPDEPFYAPSQQLKENSENSINVPSYKGSLLSKKNDLYRTASDNSQVLLDDVTDTEKKRIPPELLKRIQKSPRLSAILKQMKETDYEEDESSGSSNYQINSSIFTKPTHKQTPKLSTKEALFFGAFERSEQTNSNEKDDEIPRRSPLRFTDFESRLKNKPRLSKLLDSSQLAYQISSPEKYLEPKKIFNNPNPQPDYVIPRQLPKRPRSKLPLVIGVEPEKMSEASGNADLANIIIAERRRAPVLQTESKSDKSRVLKRLRNNPALAALFQNSNLAEHLDRNSVLSESQKGDLAKKGNVITTYTNKAAGVKIFTDETSQPAPNVQQEIEERVIPPSLFTPKGQHTRVRFVGAAEKEIPGLGTRLILPSLDPTMPAINTVMQTQGKQRDEYDTMLKIPNSLVSGGTIGFHSKTRSERFYGGDGMADAPALGPIKLNK